MQLVIAQAVCWATSAHTMIWHKQAVSQAAGRMLARSHALVSDPSKIDE